MVQRRRALVVQRTGWGKSAVYFIAASCCARRVTARRSSCLRCWRSCATRWQPPNARECRPPPSTRAMSPTGTRSTARAPRQLDRPAGQPGTAEQPRLSRQGAARRWPRRGPCGGRRSTLRLRLGPRLPARLPTYPHADRGIGHGHPGFGDHGHRQRSRGRRRRRAVRCWRKDTAGAARRPRPGVAAAVGGQGGQPGAARGLACGAHRFAAEVRHHLHPDSAKAHDVASLLREQGHQVAAYTGATEAAEREQLEADLLPTASRRWSPPRR